MIRVLLLLAALLLATPADALTIYQSRLARAGDTSTTVEWRTDAPATHEVRYGLTPALGSVKRTTTPSTAPRFPITGLAKDTDYWVEMVSIVGGVETKHALVTMSTRIRLNWPVPILAQPRLSNCISYTSSDVKHIQFMCNTDEVVTTVLEYGTRADFTGALTKSAGPLGHSHFDLYGLTPDTLYYLRATSTNQAGKVTRMPVLLYRTNPWPAPKASLTQWLAWLFLPTAAEAAPDIISTGFDRIPNFAAYPSASTVADGMSDDPAIWYGRQLPRPEDVVLIKHAVVLAAPLDVRVLGIEGALQWDDSLTITACTVQPLPGSIFAPPRRGLVLYKDCPIDRTIDPSSYGTGFVAIDAQVKLEGEPKTPFVRLAAEALAGQRTIRLAAPLTGAEPGDMLLFPDTRQLRPSQTTVVKTGTQSDPLKAKPNVGPARKDPEFEEAQAQSFSADGLTVTLASPLRFNHLGVRAPNGALLIFPHVANMTRSFVMRSANPAGTRGHVLITGRSPQSIIRYIAMESLGRTKASGLDSATFDSDGHPTLDPVTGQPKVPTNQIGRYGCVHEHHNWGVKGMVGPQFVVEGNACRDPQRWGIAIHDSHFGLIKDNIVYGATGSGIVMEDGSETRNLVKGNLVVRVDGSGFGPESFGRTKDLGHEGSCYWARGGNNDYEDNVCVAPRWAAFMFFQNLGNKVRIPTAPGNDPRIPAESTVLDVPTSFPGVFARNEGYASANGAMELWQDGLVGTPRVVWTDLTLWHVSGLYNNVVYAPGVTINGLRMYGDPAVLADPAAKPIGFGGHDAIPWKITDADIRGLRIGLDGQPGAVAGGHSLERAVLQNELNLRVIVGETKDVRGNPIMTPHTMTLTNVQSLALPGKAARHIEAAVATLSVEGLRKAVAPTTVRATNWNGENFTFYAPQRVEGYVIPGPATAPPPVGRLQGQITNAANLLKYGLSLLGPLAPCRDTPPGYVGFVCR